MQKNQYAKSAKEIVMETIEAMDRKDWKTVRSHISDNISVVAPGPVELTIFKQAEPFMNYLEHANLPPLDIKKEFADSNDVCLLYEMTYRDPPVTTFECGWETEFSEVFYGSKTFVPVEKIARDMGAVTFSTHTPGKSASGIAASSSGLSQSSIFTT